MEERQKKRGQEAPVQRLSPQDIQVLADQAVTRRCVLFRIRYVIVTDYKDKRDWLKENVEDIMSRAVLYDR